jgi:hypothetical protein
MAGAAATTGGIASRVSEGSSFYAPHMRREEFLMNRIAIILGGVVIAACLSITLAHEGEHAKRKGGQQVTITGELLDTACYVASDGEAKGKDHAQCASECLASGIPAAVLPEGSQKAADMMFLLTNPVVLAQYAGQTVKVEGTAHAEMRAIDVKKLSVREGNDWKEVQLKDAHRDMAGEQHGDHHGQQQQDHQKGQQPPHGDGHGAGHR